MYIRYKVKFSFHLKDIPAFRAVFTRISGPVQEKICQQIKSMGSRMWLLSKCPLLCVPTFAPAILCSLWNLCTILERGSFDNVRLHQCYPVELVQKWPESSGLFCTAYAYLPLELQSHISKTGCLPSTDESLQFDLPLFSDSFFPIATWKDPTWQVGLEKHELLVWPLFMLSHPKGLPRNFAFVLLEPVCSLFT